MLDVGTRPEELIVRSVAVPPVAIRPSVEMDGASNEDDITMKLMVREFKSLSSRPCQHFTECCVCTALSRRTTSP